MTNTCVLSVAEKPSVAKELAAIIGKVPPETIRKQGQSPYNPIFTIPQCSFREQSVEMHITSVSGHLMELEFDGGFKNWYSCSPVDLFTAPIIKTVKKEGELMQKTLISEAKRCSILLLWLDCDLEGENIAYEVIKVCKEANPRIDIWRARFSALIERDIIRTLKFPDRPNPHMNDAVEARQEIDLRIGAAFTRFQTLRLQKKFEDLTGVISYGPCQFPTLGFVVERDLAIKNFSPERYWSIHCESDFPHPDYVEGESMGGRGGGKNPKKTISIKFYWQRGSLYDHFSTIVLYESLFDGSIDPKTGKMNTENVLAKVIHRDEHPTSKWRPVPLNTIEFQILASRNLRIGSEKAMSIAEALYQRGIISYPRTETNYFKEGFELMTILQDFQQHSQFGTYTQGLLNDNKFLWPKNGNKDDQAHPPIHPTKAIELTQFENEEEKNIYELIVRHFLACCSKDAKGSKTTIKIQIPANPVCYPAENDNNDNENRDDDNDDDDATRMEEEDDQGVTRNIPKSSSVPAEIFTASGLMILERNYLDIYSKYDSWSGNILPTLSVGDIFIPKILQMTEGKTSPPSPISESELIKVMDNNGIGTDATIATHISTIQAREYATKDARNCFIPTPLGLALVEGYNNMGYQLNKPYLRANIEADCQRVARGQMTKQQAVEQSLSVMKKCFITCAKEVIKLDQAVAKYFRPLGTGNTSSFQLLQRRFSKCGKCSNMMDLRIEVEGAPNGATGGGGGAGANEKKDKRRYLYCQTCQKANLLPQRGEFSVNLEHTCPICQYQVLNIKNSETNKEHTICPFCFTNPPPPPDGIDGIQEFRCFSCANTDCPLSSRLAGAEVNISVCTDRSCTGFMRLKKSGKGYVLSCSIMTCKQSWWIPKFVKSAIPQDGQFCQRCLTSDQLSIVKILFSFNLSNSPRIGLEPQQLTCPVCDPLWRMIDYPSLFVRRTTPANNSSNNNPITSNPSNPYQQPNRSALGMSSSNNKTAPSSNSNNHSAVNKSNPASLSSYLSYSSSSSTVNQAYNNNHSGSSNSSSYIQSTIGVTNMQQPLPVQVIDIEESSSFGVYPPNYSSMSSSSYQAPRAPSMMSPPPAALYSTVKPVVGGETIEHPKCQCGFESKLCTVTKETQNKGRTFFGCPVRDGCKFFLWTEDYFNPTAGAVPSATTPYGNKKTTAPLTTGYGAGIENVDNRNIPLCQCGERSVQRTVQKETANKGRIFYACPRRGTDKCEFFQWQDETPAGGGGGSGGKSSYGYGGGGGGGGSKGKGFTPKKGAGPSTATSYGSKWNMNEVICSHCKENGHFAKSCPNK